MLIKKLDKKYLPGKKIKIEHENNFFGYYLYRIPSYFVTPIFIKLKLSATFASFISLISAFMIPTVAIFYNKESLTIYYIAFFGLLFHLFDHIDGNIARTTNTSSNTGKFFDMVCGATYWIFFYSSLGYIIDNNQEYGSILKGYGLNISLIIIIIDQLSRILSLYYKLNIKSTTNHKADNLNSRFSLSKSIFVSFKRISPILIIIYYIFLSIDYFLIMMLIYVLVGLNFVMANNFFKIIKN